MSSIFVSPLEQSQIQHLNFIISILAVKLQI